MMCGSEAQILAPIDLQRRDKRGCLFHTNVRCWHQGPKGPLKGSERVKEKLDRWVQAFMSASWKPRAVEEEGRVRREGG